MHNNHQASHVNLADFIPLEERHGMMALHIAYLLLHDKTLTPEQCKPIVKQLREEKQR